jgi:hypothetical protein
VLPNALEVQEEKAGKSPWAMWCPGASTPTLKECPRLLVTWDNQMSLLLNLLSNNDSVISFVNPFMFLFILPDC